MSHPWLVDFTKDEGFSCLTAIARSGSGLPRFRLDAAFRPKWLFVLTVFSLSTSCGLSVCLPVCSLIVFDLWYLMSVSNAYYLYMPPFVTVYCTVFCLYTCVCGSLLMVLSYLAYSFVRMSCLLVSLRDLEHLLSLYLYLQSSILHVTNPSHRWIE